MKTTPSMFRSRAEPRASTLVDSAVYEPSAGRAAEREVEVQERFDIVTRDGRRLAASLHAPLGRPKAALQVHPGIGIKRQSYRHFASYLAARGYAVLTLDLRGMGDSREGSVRAEKATLSDWGRRDLPAALDWLSQRYPDLPKFAVGHSLGGQITGLMPNQDQLTGLVLVFVPKGDFYACSPRGKLHGVMLMGLYMPITLALFGYAPVSRVMHGQDLPSGVAWEWIRAYGHPRWMAGYFGARAEEIFYQTFKAPILALRLDRDDWAPPDACAKLLREYYSAAPSELLTLRLADAPGPVRLDHLSYFRKQFADSHWGGVVAWLDRRVEARGSAREQDAACADSRAPAPE
jgi:predicted alpha/beta hydrolase